MIKYKQYGIDADNSCYIVGVVKTRNNKGKQEEYLQSPKYYGTLEHAIIGLMEWERLRITKECMELSELVKQIKESDDKVKSALHI